MTAPVATAVVDATATEALRRLRAAVAADTPGEAQRDADGRIVAVTEAGAVWHYRYTPNGDLAGVTGPDGGAISYDYDDGGRLVRVGHADGTTTRYRYADERLVEIDDRGVRQRIAHDMAGRVRQVTDGDDVVRCYRYGLRGLVEATAPGVVTRMDHDEAGRVLAVGQQMGDVVLRAGFAYDDDGRLAELRLPGSEDPVRYTWDAFGRPLTLAVGDRLLARFAYDDMARVVGVHLANGVVDETRADRLDGRPLRRSVRHGCAELLRRDYRYDAAARIVDDGQRRYTYDLQGRLASATDLSAVWGFSYDALGNLTRCSHSGPFAPPDEVSYSYRGDRLVGAATAEWSGAVTGDAEERLTGYRDDGGDWAWRYDAAGHLVQVRRNGAVVADLCNDHKGRPVLVRLAHGAHRHLYGLDDELLAVTDAAGRPLRLVLRTPLGVVAEVDGTLDGALDEGRVRFLHDDGRGTCLLETDVAARVVARHAYDPFGSPLGEPTGSRFGGRSYVAELGLYHLGARWYAPALRRFLVPDRWSGGPDDERLIHPVFPGARQPLARAEHLDEWLRRPRLRNRYVYCGNDPINRVDPNGHWAVGGVLLSLLGAVWTLPNTLAGLVLELSCLVGEVLRWLTWGVTLGNISWEPLGFDAAASGRLNAFALVFRGGWLGSFPTLLGITFGNVFFVNGSWEESPHYAGTGDVLPTAYHGRVRIPRSQSLYEHELRHTNQYGWFGPFFHLGLPLFGVYEWDVILHGYYDAWIERDARAHGEGPPAGDPAPAPVEGKVVVRRVRAALGRAWVYWREGADIRVLRSDGDGVLHTSLKVGSTEPWDYTEPFSASVGSAVEVAISEGARPLPASLLAIPDLLQPATLVTGTGGVAAALDVPQRTLVLDNPRELGLWPMSWELSDDAYSTAGLPQGAAAWTNANASGNLTVAEGSASPDPAGARPRARGLQVAGSVDAPRVTHLAVRLLDRDGTVLGLWLAGADDPAEEVAATLGSPSGGARPFTAVLAPTAAAAFGPVLLAIVATGTPQPLVDVFLVHLCGLQVGLVDDPAADRPGRLAGEDDEIVVVDFDRSPQDTLPALSEQTRTRRMVRYTIANEPRPLLPGGPPLPQPRMPLWMGEVALVGVSTADLAELLRRRVNRRVGDPGSSAAPPSSGPAGTATLSFRWRLRLAWDGPDSGSSGLTGPVLRPSQRHAYLLTVPATPVTVSARLAYDTQGRLVDAAGVAANDPSGRLSDAYQPAPAPVPFPVAGRRAPVVRTGQRRRWGRHAGAVDCPAVVFEFQPAVTDAAGAEVIRGGDGRLEVDDVRLDGTPVDAGLVLGDSGSPTPTPEGEPLLALPTFRIVGRNAPVADVEAVVRALVADHVDRHQADAHIRPLSRDCWQVTVLKILRHESGHRFRQFDDRGAGRRPFSRQSTTWYFGHEQEMPLFGPPHGYGIGQLDFFSTSSRGASDEEVWNWVANLRAAALVVLDEKAPAAWALIHQHVPSPLDRRHRAVYQREVVRRYNGGTEFTWTGTAWSIQPSFRWRDNSDHSRGPHPNLLYPNMVLGTGVVYYRSAAGGANETDGANTQFAWPPPIPLDPADLPAETALP